MISDNVQTAYGGITAYWTEDDVPPCGGIMIAQISGDGSPSRAEIVLSELLDCPACGRSRARWTISPANAVMQHD